MSNLEGPGKYEGEETGSYSSRNLLQFAAVFRELLALEIGLVRIFMSAKQDTAIRHTVLSIQLVAFFASQSLAASSWYTLMESKQIFALRLENRQSWLVFIASYIAKEPFRGQSGQQTRLKQPCLRLNLEHWQCRYQ